MIRYSLNSVGSDITLVAIGGTWEGQFLHRMRRGQHFRSYPAYCKLLNFFAHIGKDLNNFYCLGDAKALITPLASDIFFQMVDLDVWAFGGKPLQQHHSFSDSTQASPYTILGYLIMLERMLMICEGVYQTERKAGRGRIYDPISFRLSAADRILLFQDAMNELSLDKSQVQLANEGYLAGVRRWKELAHLML